MVGDSAAVDLLTSDVARATGGRLTGPDVTVSGASIDSRTVRAGELFVPLVAERDGHEFVAKALASGAAAYLTARGRPRGPAPTPRPSPSPTPPSPWPTWAAWPAPACPTGSSASPGRWARPA